MVPQAERTGVMVVRIWIEGDGCGLRARLTATDDISSGEETTTTAATLEDVLDVVRRWVEAFAAPE